MLHNHMRNHVITGNLIGAAMAINGGFPNEIMQMHLEAVNPFQDINFVTTSYRVKINYTRNEHVK